MTQSSHSLSHWKARHSLVVGGGIALNLIVGLPLLLSPSCFVDMLGIPVDDLIWPRFLGATLIMLAALYVPMTLDLDRFRIFAWLAIFPVRSLSALYFLIAVLCFGAASGFLIFTLIDGFISITSLYCLIKVLRLEQAIATGRADP